MTNTSVINEQDVRNLVTIGKTLTARFGLDILKFIEKVGETNVNNIYNSLKIEQSMASNVLAKFRKYNLVTTRRDGKKIFYKLNMDVLLPLLKFAESYAGTTE